MDAVCFDMDGVVVDSERNWVPLEEERIFPATVAATGDALPAASEITGMNVRDVHAHLDREYGTTVDEDAFVAEYDAAAVELYEERVSLLDGFEDVVSALRERGASVALVSSSPHRWIDRVVDRFGLADAFDARASADDVPGPGKPAPDVYEHALDELGVDPAAAVAVEDAVHGVEAASAAGMTVVAYRTTENADADLSTADAVVDSPEELRETLAGMAVAGGQEVRDR